MKKINILSIVCVALLFASCEDVVQVKLDKSDPIITIDAFVNNMRVNQTIRLTYTDSYFSQKSNEPIKGATVVIRDITNGQVFNFADNQNGNYMYTVGNLDTIGRVGHQYELTVTHQGSEYKSTSTLNRTTTIDSMDVQFQETGLGSVEGYRFAFLGFDPEGPVQDFYWIKSFRNGVFFNKGSDINICVDAAYGAGADGFPFITPIAEGITPFGEVFKKFDLCRVEIHSISPECYNFLTQIQTQTNNSGLFATTPENIKSNITTTSKTKVVGWFNMSAVGAREKVAL